MKFWKKGEVQVIDDLIRDDVQVQVQNNESPGQGNAGHHSGDGDESGFWRTLRGLCDLMNNDFFAQSIPTRPIFSGRYVI